jgi:hypothetical protein
MFYHITFVAIHPLQPFYSSFILLLILLSFKLSSNSFKVILPVHQLMMHHGLLVSFPLPNSLPSQCHANGCDCFCPDEMFHHAVLVG